MRPQALLDENVSLQVSKPLEALGYEVTAVAKLRSRGMDDEDVFALAKSKGSLIVTRDGNFTNPIRYPRD